MKNPTWKVQSPSVSLVIFGLTVTYVGICGLATLWHGTLALLFSVLLLMLELAVAAEAFDLRHQSMPWLLLVWALSVGTAASVGVWNFQHAYQPYLAATSGRYYEGVGPEARAAVLMDAGVIGFNESMVLDDSLAVGLALAGETYCVAPILSIGGPPPPSAAVAAAPGVVAFGAGVGNAAVAGKAVVQFWAIGIDCCGSRSGFVCDDAGEAGARSALVWLDPVAASAPSQQKDRFSQAIEAACALHGLHTVPHPLLLHWVKDPKNEILGLFTRSLLVWIVSSIGYGAGVSVVCIFTDYYFNAGIRGSVGEFTAGTRSEHMRRYSGPPKGSPLSADVAV